MPGFKDTINDKSYSCFLLGGLFGCMALVVFVNWFVDPLQFYHRNFIGSGQYFENQRYQMPGLARTQNYDTVIIGTSMTENFLPSMIEQRLGGEVLKLSIQGSSSREQAMILEVALQTGKVKRVIWGIDLIAFRHQHDFLAPGFPLYFYQDSYKALKEYLLSGATLVKSYESLTRQGHGDLETLGVWSGNYEFKESRVVRRLYELWKLDEVQLKQVMFINDDMMVDSVARNLAPLVAKYPDVRFDLYLPPRSILYHLFSVWGEPNYLFKNRRLNRAVADVALEHDHVNLYNFQIMEAVTTDLEHYKDVEHHDDVVNEMLIEQLAANRYLISQPDDLSSLFELDHILARYTEKICDPQHRLFMFCNTSQRVTEQAYLKYIFTLAPHHLYTFSDVADLHVQQQLQLVAPGDGLDLDTNIGTNVGVLVSGEDPYLLVNNIDFMADHNHVVRIEVESPVETTMEVFWQGRNDSGFDPLQRASASLQPGLNEVYFLIKEQVAVAPIRLDPSNKEGLFAIKSIEIRAGDSCKICEINY